MTQHAELIEQARLLGMSAERELALRSHIEALEREVEGLRKKAARYDYLTLQHGELCITYADAAPSVIKAATADRLIDAAIQHEGANDARS